MHFTQVEGTKNPLPFCDIAFSYHLMICWLYPDIGACKSVWLTAINPPEGVCYANHHSHRFPLFPLNTARWSARRKMYRSRCCGLGALSPRLRCRQNLAYWYAIFKGQYQNGKIPLYYIGHKAGGCQGEFKNFFILFSKNVHFATAIPRNKKHEAQ